MKKIILSLIAVLFIISACSDSSSPSETKEILPLKVGNEWNYSFNSEDSNYNYSFYIEKDTLINDSIWYKLKVDSLNSFLTKNKKCGLWFYDINCSDTSNSAYLKYAYPVIYDDVWYDVIKNYQMHVISRNMQVVVPAGVFSCYVYQKTYPKQYGNDFKMAIDEMYFSPGIGLIKVINFIYVDNKKEMESYQELTSYTLK